MYEKIKAKEENIGIYDYLTKDLLKTPTGSNGLIFLPYIMGERTPHLNPNATGVFIGLRGSTTKEVMTKALIEGISYSLKDCFDLLNVKEGLVTISGGGAKNRAWLQIISSMLNLEVSTTNSFEAGSLGVALLAMVAGNEYKNIEEAVKKIVKLNDTIKPIEKDHLIYEKYMKIYKMTYEQNKIIFEKEKEILV